MLPEPPALLALPASLGLLINQPVDLRQCLLRRQPRVAHAG
ncbi:hypothetical protein [Rhodoferax ferrireducens]|nr:hypothetical protein [Rhodoferax ferrireducens]